MTNLEINVGILAAYSPAGEARRLQAFAQQLSQDVKPELEAATRALWHFHLEEPMRLDSDEPHRPSDFLDEASLRMVEGPFDMVLVLTDVALVSRRQAVMPGLASPISRVAILSTRKLVLTPRGQPTRALDSAAVRANSTVLVLHLLGHILGLPHVATAEALMAPFEFTETLPGERRFTAREQQQLSRLAVNAPEADLVGGNWLQTLLFHLAAALHHPALIGRTVWRNRAPLLPLSLPSLATAAVAPTLILVFTAEIWDVGLSMTNQVLGVFGLVSILAAVWYLTGVQNLFFPRKEKRVITEHMAVVNVVIFLTILLATIGLFLMVGLLMLLIEFYIFPPNLIATWPTLENPVVDAWAKVRLAAFISFVGVLTGALAGGLESRTVIRHLALFLDEP